MPNTLYISNVPFSISSVDLLALFSTCGQVLTASMVRDKESGRPRGFGFVDMADEAGKLAAISALNGRMINGRVLKVSEARSRTDTPSRPRMKILGTGTCFLCGEESTLAGYDMEHGICNICSKIINKVHHLHKQAEFYVDESDGSVDIEELIPEGRL